MLKYQNFFSQAECKVAELKIKIMKKIGLLMLFLSFIIIVSCDKEEEDEVSERFDLLTGVEWESESLFVNGVDASDHSAGDLFENLRGTAKFNKDGTGTFGAFTGTWRFLKDYTVLEIKTVIPFGEILLPITLPADIIELTAIKLKIETDFQDIDSDDELKIEMTFRAK